MQHHNKPPSKPLKQFKQLKQLKNSLTTNQTTTQTIQCMACDQPKSATGSIKLHALDVCAPCAQRLSALPKSQTKDQA